MLVAFNLGYPNEFHIKILDCEGTIQVLKYLSLIGTYFLAAKCAVQIHKGKNIVYSFQKKRVRVWSLSSRTISL